MRGRWMWIAPLALVGIAVFAALGGFVVRALWNWLLPPLFGWHTLTFWQALGLLALCRILFGGLGMAGGGPRSRMRARMNEKWERMSPEDRERMREKMRGFAGFGRSPESPSGATEI